MTDPFANYDAWLSSPYSEGVTGQVEDDYGRYEDSYWRLQLAEYEAEAQRLGGTMDVTWDQWRAGAEDDLMSYQDFYEGWLEAKEEEARERYFEQRYPDARM